MKTEPRHAPQAGLADMLLAWYDRHRRALPWRAEPGEAVDPYRVWLSEIMLQQTTVAAVGRYFRAFTGRWPTVEALAAAPLEEVLAAWAGLGYYARARNLHACALEVVSGHGGRFPASEEALRTLPGVGVYTAGAIAAIAFGRPAVAVDGNVERVVSRLFAIETPLPKAKPTIAAALLPLVPEDRPGDFAQALMDLGATVCLPKAPQCLVCPWRDPCAGRALGIAEALPHKAAKAKRPTRLGVAFWVERPGGAVLLRRRPERGLLGGMLEVPSTPWTEEAPADPAALAPVAARWRKLAHPVEHTFTHFHLVIDVWRASSPHEGPTPAAGDYRWLAPADFASAALPTVMRKIAARAATSPASQL